MASLARVTDRAKGARNARSELSGRRTPTTAMPLQTFATTIRRVARHSVVGLGAVAAPLTLSAQPVVAPRFVAPITQDVASGRDPLSLVPAADEWPLLIAMPFAGALGAHVLGSPEGWARTWHGYGNRLGDQVGFLLIEESVRRVLANVLPPAAPRTSCWTPERGALHNLAAGSGCALWSTVAVRPAAGDGWRVNAPVTVSLLAATGASLAWRPERSDAASARTFLLTRTAIVFGGMAAGRLFDDWRHRDGVRPGDAAHSGVAQHR